MTHKGYRCIKVEEPVPGVLKVVLARPKHLNAMNGDMINDLLSLSDEIVSGYPDRYRAIVLSGEGRAFCSGGDIDFFRTLLGEPRNVVESVITRFHLFARIWYQLPLPTIAVLSGAAAGGGAALALLCDIRYAAPDAKIGFPFINIGLVPDFGTHLLLPALAGRDKALELMYSGDFVSAEEAARIGLITRIFPRERAESEAVAIAARLAGKSPDVLRSIKKLAGEARNLSLTEVLAREVETQAGRFKTPEFEAHVRDFLARS